LERHESDSDASDSYRPTKLVTTEMPTATTVADDEEDTDDRSFISGLTASSAVTRQVMEEIENEMDKFIKIETKAIQKMLDEQEDLTPANSLSNSSATASVFGDESVRVTMKAEAMARDMQNVLDNFVKEDASLSQNGQAQEGEDDAVSTSKYPHKYVSANSSEDWMVYYDETYQREYYYEKSSNRTEWQPPSSTPKKHERQMMSEDVMPETPRSMARISSRRGIYRKRLRKRRIRRFVAFSVAMLCAGASYLHWQTNHPDKTYTEAMEETWKSSSEIAVKMWEISSKIAVEKWETSSKIAVEKWETTSKYIKDQLEYTITDRKIREEATRLETERNTKLEKDTRAKKEAELKAREEAERRAAVERKRQEKLAVELKAREEARKRELELKAQKKVEEEAARLKDREREEAARTARESEAKHRPWGCNIPLAYIYPRCFRLAKENPIYNADDLPHLQ
jgi:hypothetical protein